MYCLTILSLLFFCVVFLCCFLTFATCLDNSKRHNTKYTEITRRFAREGRCCTMLRAEHFNRLAILRCTAFSCKADVFAKGCMRLAVCRLSPSFCSAYYASIILRIMMTSLTCRGTASVRKSEREQERERERERDHDTYRYGMYIHDDAIAWTPNSVVGTHRNPGRQPIGTQGGNP